VTALPVNEAVSRIEAELAAFWSTPDTQAGEPMAKVRASTMSFVALTGAAEIAYAREVTDRLADTHPGRAFLVTVDGRLAPWDVSYEVRAACRLDGGAQPICYDWIEMSFGAMAAERAPSVISALALPEVPLVVEVGPGATKTVVSALAPRAHRLIVDSAHTSVARLADIARAVPAVPIGDRQFVRTYSWRDLVARFFDDAHGALWAIKEITIARTPGGPTDPAALLLGWLGAQLDLTFEGQKLARDRRGEAVNITVRDEARADLGPGQIVGVWIETELSGEWLSLGCARTEAPGTLRWTRSGAKSGEHEIPLGFRDEDWVLVKAIDSTESDRIYRRALLAAADWSAR
jgi:glucose-6-phosphate dehydrogenase assembly protein OpcA